MSKRVLCFGEVLWDLLPHGRFLGGAPLNVAYHVARLGCTAQLASAVGTDALGEDALAAIARAGLPTHLIRRHPTLPTGIAQVQLDAQGQARFVLPQPVAWDDLPGPVTGQPAPDALVFGTLALRSPANRAALTRHLDAVPGAWIVGDLNLRPPFDDLEPLAELLRRIDLVKVNADEARRLCAAPPDTTDWPALAAELTRRFPRADVCITLGADGAGLLTAGHWHQVAAPAITVRDTIGAGDAFTAALVAGRLRAGGRPDWDGILRAACRLGGFVASRDGAQPDYAGFDPGLPVTTST